MAALQLRKDLQSQVQCALQSIPQAKHAAVLQNGLYLESSTGKNNSPVFGKKVGADNKERKYMMIYANELSIGDSACNWEYSLVPDDPPNEDKLVTIAELIKGVNVKVEGDSYCTSYLDKGITYEVAYQVMITRKSYGLENPMTLKFVDPKGKGTEFKVRLDRMPKNTWEFVRVGVFLNDGQATGKVQFSMTEVACYVSSKGRCVRACVHACIIDLSIYIYAM
ncbi:hypothetical protein Scep_013460 [Stephania cephalantha]|uniref:Uncharacterized protein n=1 Tax=Stephania cephalantha TaxID=152367 RepID=A0AAP0JHE5_9MAGN